MKAQSYTVCKQAFICVKIHMGAGSMVNKIEISYMYKNKTIVSDFNDVIIKFNLIMEFVYIWSAIRAY